ncbi:MAG: SAM-dependent DNA methyltransferase, partial [Mycobacterium leprae]
VDVNPMAAELAKVSLWLEAFEPGKPLSFLDAHIKVGNSLLWATPRLLLDGVPDAAFKPIEGDDKKVASTWMKRNRSQRSGQLELDVDDGAPVVNETLGAQLRAIVEAPADSLADVHALRSRFRSLQESAEHARLREVAHAWCAAFV